MMTEFSLSGRTLLKGYHFAFF